MAKNTTESLYQNVIDGVAALLAAVKGEAKANKRLSNSVARIERLEKTIPTFQAKYVKITTAKEEPEVEAKPAKKAAAKPAKKGKTAAKAKPAAKAEPATEAKKPAKAAAKKKAKPAPEVIPDIEEAPEEATIN